MPLTYLKEKYRRHKVRATPTGDSYCFADSIDYLVSEHWDEVVAGHGVPFSRAYLRCLEENRPAQLSLKYCLVYRDGQAIAGIAMQILDADFSSFLPTDSKFAAGGRFVGSRIFVCGSLLCWGNQGVAIRTDVEAKTVWPSVAEALLRIRRAEKLTGETDFVLVRDLPKDDPDAKGLKDYGYRPVAVESDMVLELRDWSSFDDYLASLQSKYRKAAKTLRMKLEKAGCELVELERPEEHQERLHELYCAVWANADVRPVQFAPSYLTSLKGALGDDFSCLAIKQEDKILGFVTLLNNGDSAIGYILGFDREAAKGLPIYLRLLQAVVEQALSWGAERVSFGGTALEPKARLGAVPQEREVWARHRLSPLNVLIRPLLEKFSPQQAPERSPFKKS